MIGGVIRNPRHRTVRPHSGPYIRGLPFALCFSSAATRCQQWYRERRERGGSPTSFKVTQRKIATKLESISTAVIPACFWRESRLPFPSDGSPPTSCGDDRSEWLFPTCVIGNPSWPFSDGSPLPTDGDEDWCVFELDSMLNLSASDGYLMS